MKYLFIIIIIILAGCGEENNNLKLKIIIENEGSVEINGEIYTKTITKEYKKGTEITLKALDGENFKFYGWKSDEYPDMINNTNSSIIFFIDGYVTKTAVFQRKADFKRLNWTSPVLFEKRIDSSKVIFEYIENGSDESDFAQVELILKNLPKEAEGSFFTLVGGGVNSGFHSLNSTNFDGDGYHFAGGEGNPPRDENYKKDFTKRVENGVLSFTFYYKPTDIISNWDPNIQRYVKNSEITLTLHPKGALDNKLKSDINQYNWCIANLGIGNKAVIMLQ